jgi:PKHD-type hydroxylase
MTELLEPTLSRTPQERALYTLPPPRLPQYADVCWFEEAFSREDVARIREVAELFPPETATVGNAREIDAGIRTSVVRWVSPTTDSVWLFDRLAQLVGGCNQSRYGFDLWGLNEGLQVAEYGPGGFFSWHKDHGRDAHSIRKLSVTIQLSDPGDYEGGDMEFLFGPDVTTAPRGFGTAIVFPSYVMHRVTPVTRGVRRSVVAWVSGPPYR